MSLLVLWLWCMNAVLFRNQSAIESFPVFFVVLGKSRLASLEVHSTYHDLLPPDVWAENF